MATPKHGQPKVGRRYARFLTRRESEITGLTRTVVIEVTKKGDLQFTKSGQPLVKGVKRVKDKLTKFWNA